MGSHSIHQEAPHTLPQLSPSAGLCVEWILLPTLGLHSPVQDPCPASHDSLLAEGGPSFPALEDTMWP